LQTIFGEFFWFSIFYSNILLIFNQFFIKLMVSEGWITYLITNAQGQAGSSSFDKTEWLSRNTWSTDSGLDSLRQHPANMGQVTSTRWLWRMRGLGDVHWEMNNWMILIIVEESVLVLWCQVIIWIFLDFCDSCEI